MNEKFFKIKVWLRTNRYQILLTIVNTLVIGIVILFMLKDRTPTYPLVFDQRQNVLREPALFHLDEPVEVESTFLNTTKETILFTASVKWVLVSPTNDEFPPGSELVILAFNDRVISGCKELRFSNEAPIPVRRTTQKLFTAGAEKVVWKIVGENIVTSPKHSGSLDFETEEFTYVPDKQILPPYESVRDLTNCENIKKGGI